MNFTRQFKGILFFLLLVVQADILFAQLTFQRTFQAAGMNGGLALDLTSDGGYVVTGQHGSSGEGLCDVYVYKRDACGNTDFFNTYGDSLSQGGKCVKQTADGGFIVIGITQPYTGQETILMKLDASGAFQWMKNFGSAISDWGMSVQQTTDGGFIMTGSTVTPVPYTWDAFLIKTDASGNMLWSQVYGAIGEEFANDVVQTQDGGYFLTGYSRGSVNANDDVLAIKTDALGNVQWSNVYGGTNNDGNARYDGLSIYGTAHAKQTPDGGYAIVSNTRSFGVNDSIDIWLLKLDSGGNLLWNKTFGGTNNEEARGMDLTYEGGFAIVGWTMSFGFGEQDVYLLKTDSQGTLEWSSTYGGAAREKGESIKQSRIDHGYYIDGYSASFTSNYAVDIFDAYAIKTDSTGSTGCNESSPVTIEGTGTPVVSPFPTTIYTLPTRAPDVFFQHSYNPGEYALCEVLPPPDVAMFSAPAVCPMFPMNFTDASTAGYGVVTDWIWDFGDGSPLTYSVQNPAHTYTASGTYSVTLVMYTTYSCIPDSLTLQVTVNPLPLANLDGNNVCFNNSTTFTDLSTGNNSVSQWDWDFGDLTPHSGAQSPTHTYAGLGTYTVSLIVTNNYGCKDTNTTLVTVNPLPVVNFASTTVCAGDSSCFNDLSSVSTGTVTAWSWNFDDPSSGVLNTSTQQNPCHVFVASGLHNVLFTAVSDSGCPTNTTVPITQSTPVSGTTSQTNIDCNAGNSGDATINSSGGTPSYTYLWNNGQTTQTASGLTVGNYSVLVTDSRGCISATTVTITQPAVLTSVASSTTLTCNGNTNGTANVIPAGGTPSYSYLWNNGQTAQTAVGLTAGSYSVVITDANGCTGSDTVTIVQPALLTSTSSQTAVLCNGGSTGSVSVLSAGGTPGYTYNWNNGQTTSAISGVAAGNYSVLITDANGCTGTNSITVTQPATLTSSASQVAVLCNGGTGSVSVIAAGGTQGYTYNWNNGQTTSAIAGITAGNYSVTVIDANGCVSQSSVALTEPPAITISVVGNDSICAGDNATLNAITTGGTPAYTYVWVPGPQSGSSVVIAPNSSASYSVAITDANGCTTLVQSFNVVVVPPPSALFDTMSNGTYGSIFSFHDLSSGGSSAWSWDFGDGSTGSSQQNPIHTFPGSGTYTVTQVVFNQFGCPDTFNLIINILEGIIIPNVFTPDGDGTNDVWYIPNSGMKEFNVEIFNRWGEKVFETTADEIRWDGHTSAGRMLSDGTYYYVLKAFLKSGLVAGGKDYSTTGYVTLLTNRK